jgi:putative ABC transport system permease protein
VLIQNRETSSAFPEWNYRVWLQLQQRRGLFDSVAAYTPTARANMTLAGDTQKIDGLIASGSFFDTLGVPAMIGRTFSEQDDQAGGGPDGPVAVISYRFWQRHFHGAPDAVGKTLPLENVAFTIVGVMGPDFFGPDVGRTFDAIVPIGTEPLVSRRESVVANTDATWLNLIARLRPDEGLDAATAELRRQQAQIFELTHPEWTGDALKMYLSQTFTLVPAATGSSSIRQVYERPLLTILCVVAIVLLIACANIANLLLARATARRHELSVRLALGASRWRLARQLLTESVLLAAIGSALGLMIASWSSRLLVRELSTQTRTMFLDTSIDAHVLAFTIAVTAITALLFGAAPALQVSSVAPMDALKERAQTGTAGQHRGRVAGGMVVAQIALSLVLVVAAGLFVRTFVALASRDLGFQRERILVASVNAHSAAIDPTQRLRIYAEARDAVRELPGVADAALSAQTPPIDGATMILPLKQVSGGELLTEQPLGERMAILGFIGPGFFSTFATPITAGREFTERDGKGAPLVAIVNHAFSAKYLNGADPVGRTLQSSSPALSMTIVGVAGDAVYRSVRAPVQPVVYIPLRQATWAPTPLTAQINLVVRTSATHPELLVRSAGAAIRATNPDLAVTFGSF